MSQPINEPFDDQDQGEREPEGFIFTAEDMLHMYKAGMLTNLGFASYALEMYSEDGTPMVRPDELKDFCLLHGMKRRTYYDVVKKLKKLGYL